VFNIKTDIKGTKLVIVIDTTADGGISKSGKSQIIATTAGAILVGDAKLNLNLYRSV